MKNKKQAGVLIATLVLTSAPAFATLQDERAPVTPEGMVSFGVDDGWEKFDDIGEAREYFLQKKQPGMLQFRFCKKQSSQWACRGYDVSYNINSPHAVKNQQGVNVEVPTVTSRSFSEEGEHIDVQMKEVFFGESFSLKPEYGAVTYDYLYRALPEGVSLWEYVKLDEPPLPSEYYKFSGMVKLSDEPIMETSNDMMLWFY